MKTDEVITVDRSSDIKHMRLALSLAKKGKDRVFPNPMVGCVIVKGGKVVGTGYHEFFGGPHAEINALLAAGKKAFNSTLYVTLEPCNHFGKTPPCTNAIIHAGVKRVVAATLDPKETMRGSGLRSLAQHSIEVSHGVLGREAARINADFVKRQKDRSSSVTAKVAMSIDGKIATRTGDSKWISSFQSRTIVHRLRSNMDAVIVGSETALRDNPFLTSHGAGRNPVRVVLDSTLRVPLTINVFNGEAPTIVFYSRRNAGKRLVEYRNRKVMTVQLSERRGEMPFASIIETLRQFSLKRILVEGGGETIASAIESGVVTDVMFFISPKIIGGRLAKTAVEGLGVARIKDSLRLDNPRVTRIGRDVLFTARIRKTQSRSGAR